MRQRPDTKFKPIMITNVLYTVYRTAFPLGCGRKLPRYILKTNILFHLIKTQTLTKYMKMICACLDA